MARRKYRVLKWGVALLVCAVGAVAVLPWKPWVEARLIETIEAYGLADVKLTIANVGPNHAVLNDISVGGAKLLDHLTLAYSPQELWARRLHSLSLSGLALTMSQTGDGWGVDGFTPRATGQSAAFTLPFSAAQLQAMLPIAKGDITNSTLQVHAKPWVMEVPLDLAWEFAGAPQVTYKAPALRWKSSGGMSVETGAVTLQLVLDEAAARWNGNWAVQQMQLANAPLPLPALDGKGTLSVQKDRVLLEGSFASADAQYGAAFTLEQPLVAAGTSTLVVKRAAMPWNGGTIAIRDAKIPLGGNRAINLTLHVEHVSITMLMESLTGKRATGTGYVTGNVPLTIHADGSFTLHAGSLRAEAAGVIAIAPETIPGDNAQITVVRELLKDLHYQTLSISMDSAKDRGVSVVMLVEGNNPGVYDGRPVRLNVHLTGNLLDLVQQNMATITDPKSFLKREAHEKN